MELPLYDFQCKACGALTEHTENIPPACYLCGEIMIRLWTSTPVHFKGTGFYVTGG
jgi:putative FmdB family regulatory protein